MSNKKQNKMEFKLSEKKAILARFIEVLVNTGYDINPYIYKPLSHWDFEGLIKLTIDHCEEFELTLDDREIEYLENNKETIEETTEELTLDQRQAIGREKFPDWKKAEEVLKAIDIIQTNNREETQEKFEGSQKYDYKEFCNCCGRGIKGEPKFAIWTVEGPSAVPTNTTEEQMADVGLSTQGSFPIGSECAKKYPKEYITNWN